MRGCLQGRSTQSNNISPSRGVTFWGNSFHLSLETLTKQYLIAPIRIPQPACPSLRHEKATLRATACRLSFEPPTEEKLGSTTSRSDVKRSQGGPEGARRLSAESYFRGMPWFAALTGAPARARSGQRREEIDSDDSAGVRERVMSTQTSHTRAAAFGTQKTRRCYATPVDSFCAAEPRSAGRRAVRGNQHQS